MAREIKYDKDTLVGYNFATSMFYVVNKGTTAYRTSSQDAKTLLDIVAPNNTITTQQIQSLHDNLEELQNLSYTLADNGAYITTIQINTYKENPITIDLQEKKIYIMNTNIIYDLTLNEATSYRVEHFISYFLSKHGVNISRDNMTSIYNILVSAYNNPIVYNEVETPQSIKDTLTYNNKVVCPYLKDTNKIGYIVEVNPNNTFTYNNISKIEGNIIYFTNPITLIEGDKILVEEGEIKGTYTSNENVEDVTFVEVKETLETPYTYPLYKANLLSSVTNIVSISRDTKEITLENAPINIEVGDKIKVEGTIISSTTSQDTADGTYTVTNITDNVVEVEEQPLINYTYEIGTPPQLYKEIEIGNIVSIENSIAKLQEEITITIPTNSIIRITENNTLIGNYKAITSTTEEITLQNAPTYTPRYPQALIPSMNCEVATTDSKSDNFPTGIFIVDTFEQAIQYISTYPLLPLPYIPTQEHKNNLYSKVPTTISVSIGQITSMNLLGLYSQIYTDKTKK